MLTLYDLEKGAVYVVIKSFDDHIKTHFPEGKRLTYVERHFLPYHGGHTIVFEEAMLYLQESDDAALIVSFHEHLVLCEASRQAKKPDSPPPKKRESRWAGFGQLVVELGLMTVSLWMALTEDRGTRIAAGWGGAVLFGLAAAVSLKKMFNKRGTNS